MPVKDKIYNFTPMDHKAGFVNIIGNPNVGKSTLLNALLKNELSIITHKAQTTRHRILGILNNEKYQIVFSDTPGIILPHYALQEAMMKSLKESLRDGDVLLYLVEEKQELEDKKIFQKIQNTKIPLFILINKIDKISIQELEDLVGYWHELFPKALILPISALTKTNLELLLNKILDFLPKNPPFYPKDQLSDRPERFFVNEVIREKILIFYKKEIPYSVEITTESFVEEERKISIESKIYVERDSQKAILIGHKGKSLSNLGKKAREKLKKIFGKEIYLHLRIEVNKNWRSNPKELKKWGYIP